MRRLILFAALLAWLTSGLSAQNPAPPYSLDSMTRSLFDRLDKSGLHSGILLQQSAVFVNPFRFDGSALTDSNRMDASRFGKLFGQLRAASVNRPVLPDPAIYLDEIRQQPDHSDTILWTMLAMQFDYVRADAFQKGLLKWDNDHKIIAVAGSTTSPYRLDTTFAFAALKQATAGKQVVFRLPNQFIFQNLGWIIRSLELDFGDGQGWRRVRPDECVTVLYNTSGKKSLRLQVRQGGRNWQGYTFVEVPKAESKFAALGEYSAEPDEIISLGGVELNMFFDCVDSKLRKPLIIVEGFGGDRTNYAKMFDLINFNLTTPTLKDFSDAQGCDLIWIDWTDSNASIPNNTAALQGALEYINARKHANRKQRTQCHDRGQYGWSGGHPIVHP